MILAIRPRPGDQDAGFTLLELLVGITLLSLLSFLLTSSLRFGLTAWTRGGEHLERIDNGLLAQNFLRRVIGDAYPYFHSLGPDHRGGQVEFTGSRRSLRFLASAPEALGGRGHVRFEIRLETGSKHPDLVVISTPELFEHRNRQVLLHDIQTLEFSYLGKKRSDKSETWHSEWVDEPAMPRLVRMKVQDPSDNTRPWPDLLIAPRIGADVSCVHDLLTKQCRGR